MNLRTIVQRIRRGEVQYALGRFRIVRRAYGRFLGLCDVLRGTRQIPTASDTLFSDVDVDKVVREIKAEAVSLSMRLPSDVISEIEAFGRTQPLHARNHPAGYEFFYDGVRRGYTADGMPAPLGGIKEPTRCPAVKRVSEDPVLRAIVRKYLGYEPRKVLTILDWSFASDFSDEERRRLKHHVIDYHYDVGGFNFVYANFYIVDTDRHSGAHQMMKRSHKRKPLRMLLGSAAAEAADVRREFGVENEITIEGPAGTGFVQDTSCFHRATPPTRGDRLMLAIRFS